MHATCVKKGVCPSIHLTVVCLKHLLDIVHRDLKLENILLSQPVGNELLNIKVRILKKLLLLGYTYIS